MNLCTCLCAYLIALSMKTIEIRRHSIRHKPGDHLNQAGVTLARQVGEKLGPFERIVTSTLPRALETAIAMGFAVDEQNRLMSSYGIDVEREVPWPQSFFDYAKGIQRNGAASQYAGELAAYYANLANHLLDGHAALVVNHGGVLELGVVAAYPEADYESWGEAADYCEGARLFWDNEKFIDAEVLRVSK
jgi:broad specificity phosphatase PhoE